MRYTRVKTTAFDPRQTHRCILDGPLLLNRIQKFAYSFASAAIIFCSGCKLSIAPHNVGGVATDSGNYECRTSSWCLFDIVDIFFEETFTAVPGHPNYRFKQWRRMERGFCGGSSGPCALSTTGFAGHDILEAFLRSDEVFFLTPEFERIGPVETAEIEYPGDGKQVVIDAEGKSIGTIQYGSWSSDINSVPFDPIGINIHFKGLAATYILLLEESPFSGKLQIATSKNDLAYAVDNCWQQSIPTMILPEPGEERYARPAFPPTPLVPRSSSLFYIPDPVGRSVRSTWGRTWDSVKQRCRRAPENEGVHFPLISTNVSLDYPLTVAGTNIVIEAF